MERLTTDPGFDPKRMAEGLFWLITRCSLAPTDNRGSIPGVHGGLERPPPASRQFRVQYTFQLRSHYGITDFVLCLDYKGDMIKDYFLHYEARNCDLTVTLRSGSAAEIHGSRIEEDGWRVTLVDSGEVSMTGARIKWASGYLDPGDRTFCVTYGDGLIDMDLGKTLRFTNRTPGSPP